MLSKSYWWKSTLLAAFAAAAWGGTFGTVVSIGGTASGVALDEPRGVLYIANFTANQIDVMSLSNYSIETSINVAAQPSSLAVSPDDHWLVITHFGNAAPPASSTNLVTVIDLTTSGKQTFALGSPPLGVAFGIDGQALVVTTTDFELLDPASGNIQQIGTIAGVVANTLPQPPASFPTNIVAATVGASGDGTVIYGFSATLLFSYNVATQTLSSGLYTSTPTLGPSAISVSQDGSYFTAGWTLKDSTFYNISQFANVSGALNVGTTAIDSVHNVIYAQIPPPGTTSTSTTGTGTTGTTPPATTSAPPTLQVVASDNLTVLNTINLPENFAGNSVLSSDGSVMYGVSASGVMVLPVGALNQAPQVQATQQDLVFRGNFCNRNVATQTLTVVDPSGGNTPFVIASNTTGLNVSPASGVTPATITVTVDPNVFQGQQGTVTASLQIQSGLAVNVPPAVRVLINSRQPDQRGSFVDIPGTLVDLVADPNINRAQYFVLRQDMNEVLVFNSKNNTQIATLRTGNTPMGMAVTFDQQYLLVGCNNSQYLYVYDLDTLQPVSPVKMYNGDYVQSVASSSNAILAVVRDAGGASPNVHSISLITNTSTQLPTLGVYNNVIPLNSVLASSSNGSSILLAGSDGTVMLYSASSGTFSVSRKDFTALSGAYAASNFNYYVVGNNLLDSSGVPIGQFETGTGASSGFAFVDPAAFRTTAQAPSGGGQSTSPGTIERLDLSNPSNVGSLATPIVEAPLLGSTNAAFTRTLAPLPDQSAIINLTVSGVTILPPDYDASVAPPQINTVVNAADLTSNIAPGGLITLFGSQLSPVNLASAEMPLPTALANSCLTVNGLPMPILFVSPTQVNAQMPFEAVGDVTLMLATPGGVSDNYNLVVQTNAPSIFRVPAPNNTTTPTIIRNDDHELVTASHPIHRNANEALVIYTTGLGVTAPAVASGSPSPANPLAVALTAPTVTLGGASLPVLYYGLAPGEVGVYQINVSVPGSVPLGLDVPLVITQGSGSTSVNVRVVD
jgi:uncharacterized protein (TIGR03437 family)